MPDVKELYEEIHRRKPPIPDALEKQHRLQVRHVARRRHGGYAVAAAIAISTLIAIGVVGDGGTELTPGGSGSPTPSYKVDPLVGALALPPEEATPTAPVRGRLVLSFEDTTINRGMHVYEDGRLLRYDLGDFSDDPDSIGVSVQRLTPRGVEMLRRYALATGLFEHDLSLDRGDGGMAPFSQVRVADGGSLVTLTWAWQGVVGRDAPGATPQQATAIEDLLGFLGEERAWSAGAWGDETETAFVPAQYDVCMRGLPRRIDAMTSMALLPTPVVDLLWGVDGAPAGDGDVGCTRVSTDDARALAGVFDAAGIYRTLEGDVAPEWLHYGVHQPDTNGNTLWIVFAPVLPSGEAIFIGPG